VVIDWPANSATSAWRGPPVREANFPGVDRRRHFGIRSAAVDHGLGISLAMRCGHNLQSRCACSTSPRPGLRVFANSDSEMQRFESSRLKLRVWANSDSEMQTVGYVPPAKICASALQPLA